MAEQMFGERARPLTDYEEYLLAQQAQSQQPRAATDYEQYLRDQLVNTNRGVTDLPPPEMPYGVSPDQLRKQAMLAQNAQSAGMIGEQTPYGMTLDEIRKRLAMGR